MDGRVARLPYLPTIFQKNRILLPNQSKNARFPKPNNASFYGHRQSPLFTAKLNETKCQKSAKMPNPNFNC